MHVGIDLGTTFSAVAYYDKHLNKPVIINNRYDNTVTPTVLCYKDNTFIYGEDAKDEQLLGNPNTIAFFKRNMGDKSFSVRFADKTYSAEDLSAIFLSFIIKDAEKRLGEKITSAVITVPAYFNNLQRQATINAGNRAGIQVLRIINEPTAAAIAYGITGNCVNKTIMVYDLGGGTFDVTVAKITDHELEIMGCDGDHNLGGKNWDDMVAFYIAEKIKDEKGIDIFEEQGEDYYELLVKSENAKRQLTSKDSTVLSVAGTGYSSKYELSLDTFNQITDSLMEKTRLLCNSTLEDLHISWLDLDGVLLVGGSTRMRVVSDFVKDMSGKLPLTGINVDSAVALGAAIQADIDILEASTKTTKEIFSISSKKITDVTAHSLGMIAINEDFSKYINSILIPKNRTIPSSNIKPFKATARNCKNGESDLYILQGENENPLDCVILGKYVITRIDFSHLKEVILDIRYDYDMNGVVKVSVTQRDTKKSLTVRVEEIPEDISWLLEPPSHSIKPDPIYILLCVDLSGSMAGRPLKEAKKAAQRLIDSLDTSYTHVGLVVFADKTETLCIPTTNAKQIFRAIDSMKMRLVGQGTTAEPFSRCMKELNNISDKKYIIVLTDGVWAEQNYAINKANECKNKDIEIISIGFGDADKDFLERIASTDEGALLTDLSNLTQSFSNIAQAITEGNSNFF